MIRVTPGFLAQDFFEGRGAYNQRVLCSVWQRALGFLQAVSYAVRRPVSTLHVSTLTVADSDRGIPGAIDVRNVESSLTPANTVISVCRYF